jgi:hypothetical protein
LKNNNFQNGRAEFEIKINLSTKEIIEAMLPNTIIIIIIITQFLYLSACQQRVVYNRRALMMYTTKDRLRLEPELN